MWSRIISTRSQLMFPPSHITSVFSPAVLASEAAVILLLCDWPRLCQGKPASRPWLRTSQITLVLVNHPWCQSKGDERGCLDPRKPN